MAVLPASYPSTAAEAISLERTHLQSDLLQVKQWKAQLQSMKEQWQPHVTGARQSR